MSTKQCPTCRGFGYTGSGNVGNFEHHGPHCSTCGGSGKVPTNQSSSGNSSNTNYQGSGCMWILGILGAVVSFLMSRTL